MTVASIEMSRLRQETIRAKCVHPRGRWTEFPRQALDESVVARFERIVDTHSQRLAVKHDEVELTYAELDRRVNRLAQALLAQRGPQAEPVALLLSQGFNALVAMLAVLKAGKFYVVLDQDQPKGTPVGDVAGFGCRGLDLRKRPAGAASRTAHAGDLRDRR